MKKYIFLFFILIFIICFFTLRQVNVCNFSSFEQFKYSIKTFGKNPYINCTGVFSNHIINAYRLISKFSEKRNLENSEFVTNEKEISNKRSGEKIYKTYCASCHSSNRNNVPRYGDASAWNEIKKKGLKNLIYTTKNGLNSMPQMGLCNDCSDRELESAIKFIIGMEDSYDISNNQEIIDSKNIFKIKHPTVIQGEQVLYPIENDSYQTNLWNRSHGSNRNTKYFKTDISSNDQEKILKLKWRYDFFDIKKNKKFYLSNIEVNPVAYKNSLFVLGPDHRFISFEAATGKINWELMLPPVIGMAPRRGILVEDDKVFLNIGAKLFAFDYLTGKTSPGFSPRGVVSGGSPSAPFIYDKNIYIVSLDGFVRGFNINSGDLIAEIPYRNDDMPGYSAVPWGGVALDSKTGYVYFSTGNPKPDLVGVSRPGSNYGANTIYAINLNNKKIAWTFQAIQHDVWDLDLPSPPILANIKISHDSELRVVISVSKAGNTLIFDRISGKNLHDIEWVAVNTDTDIPGEILSPVQMKLSLPERLSKIEYHQNDFLNGSPEELKEINTFLSKSNLGFFPPHSIGKTSVIYGIHGGGEWTGGSFNENTGEMFTPINQIPWKLRIQGKTSNEFNDMNENFKTKWGNQYSFYKKNCLQCHGSNRQGSTLKTGEKEVMYKPSLVGLFLGNAKKNQVFRNSFTSSHPKLSKMVNLDEMLKFHMEWDEALQKKNLISFQGSWSRFLTKDGNFATDLPYGKIVSSNPLTGKINWETPVGETKIFNSTRKGKSMFGGIASSDDNLLYVTGSDDSRLYVLNQTSGKILYHKDLVSAGSAPPTLFASDAKTNVAVLATGGIFHNYKNKGASLYVFEH